MSDVAFAGQAFRRANAIGLMPLMRFAKVAQSGVDTQDMAALAAMYDLLQTCIDRADWPRFEQAATDSAASAEDLMRVFATVMKQVSEGRRVDERPTGLSSDSSDGQPTTPPSSADTSSSIARLATRPDLQLVISRAQEARAQTA